MKWGECFKYSKYIVEYLARALIFAPHSFFLDSVDIIIDFMCICRVKCVRFGIYLRSSLPVFRVADFDMRYLTHMVWKYQLFIRLLLYISCLAMVRFVI